MTRTDYRNQFCRIVAPRPIQLTIRDLIVAHLAFNATMITAMAARLNALIQDFINDDLPDLRPTPPGEKSGISESSGELPEQHAGMIAGLGLHRLEVLLHGLVCESRSMSA